MFDYHKFFQDPESNHFSFKDDDDLGQVWARLRSMTSKIEKREVEVDEEMEQGIINTSQLFDEIWKEFKMRKNARQITVIFLNFVRKHKYFEFQFDRRQERKRRESLMKIYREMVCFSFLSLQLNQSSLFIAVSYDGRRRTSHFYRTQLLYFVDY